MDHKKFSVFNLNKPSLDEKWTSSKANTTSIEVSSPCIYSIYLFWRHLFGQVQLLRKLSLDNDQIDDQYCYDIHYGHYHHPPAFNGVPLSFRFVLFCICSIICSSLLIRKNKFLVKFDVYTDRVSPKISVR